MTVIGHPRADQSTAVITPLSAIPSDWDNAWRALALRASEPNAFAESPFLRASIANLDPPKDAQMLSVWQGPDLLGMMPLVVASRYGRLPVNHVQNWLHYHAFLGTPLVRARHEPAFWSLALEALDAADWAPAFLHINGLVGGGPVLAGLRAVRRADVVHQSERALLETDLAPHAYYETTVRKKKRKEIGRLQSRLRELGTVACTVVGHGDIDDAIAEFLALEASGWKGANGSALALDAGTRAFFTAAVRDAAALGRAEILRLALDGKPIAMLVNLLSAPGSFSFKIAFNEDYARFSPGVLIQLENLHILDQPDIAWMDSCAVADHSMINSLWGERRSIVRVTVPLKGARRRAIFSACRSVEAAAAFARRLT